MNINEILDKLENGNFDRPNQKMNYILQVRQYIKKLESENQELKKDNIIKYEYLIEAQKNQIAKLEKENKRKSGFICVQEVQSEELYQENEKLKKVIEIFKENNYTLATDSNEEKYYLVRASKFHTITQQEYDLLKEVFE